MCAVVARCALSPTWTEAQRFYKALAKKNKAELFSLVCS
jgi:hypothetical protein